MKRRLLLLALLSSCGPLASEVAEPLVTVPDAGAPAPVVVADAGPQVEADGGVPPLTGLPCEVRAVLETHCTGCHAGQTYAPHLTSRADFLQARINSTQLVGQFALQRMQPGAQYPMPPYGYQTQPSAQDVAVISGWVNAGMPGGACGVAVGH